MIEMAKLSDDQQRVAPHRTAGGNAWRRNGFGLRQVLRLTWAVPYAAGAADALLPATMMTVAPLPARPVIRAYAPPDCLHPALHPYPCSQTAGRARLGA
jgi:hypothetical protein